MTTRFVRGILSTIPILAAVVCVGGAAESEEKKATTPTGCVADAARLCKGIQVGGGRVLHCLAKKESKLSASCRAVIHPIKPEIIGWRNACGVDIDRHCGKLPPGGLLAACLGAHKATLAPACKVKLASAAAYAHLVCMADSQKHCSNVKPGGGRVIECLDKKKPALGAACRTHINRVGPWVIPWRKACGADIDSKCPRVHRPWQVLTCLEVNKPKLATACKAKVEKTEKAFALICARDIKTHCAGITPGNGRIVTCLHKKRTSLRPVCKAIVP